MPITEEMKQSSLSIGKSIFQIELPVTIIKNEEMYLGMYDNFSDTIILNETCIETTQSRLNVPLIDLVKHTICHELGHGLEARSFATNHVYPWQVMISNLSRMNLFEQSYRTDAYKNEISIFLNTIVDGSIDKKIKEHGIVDHTFRNQINEIKNDINNDVDYENRLTKLNTLFNLPLYVNNYINTDNDEKDIIKEYVESCLGEDSWTFTYNSMDQYSYGEVDVLKTLFVQFCIRLFNLRPEWREWPRYNIRNSLPPFWEGDQYYMLFID